VGNWVMPWRITTNTISITGAFFSKGEGRRDPDSSSWTNLKEWPNSYGLSPGRSEGESVEGKRVGRHTNRKKMHPEAERTLAVG